MGYNASNRCRAVSSRRLLGAVKSSPPDVTAAEAICPLHLVNCLQA